MGKHRRKGAEDQVTATFIPGDFTGEIPITRVSAPEPAELTRNQLLAELQKRINDNEPLSDTLAQLLGLEHDEILRGRTIETDQITEDTSRPYPEDHDDQDDLDDDAEFISSDSSEDFLHTVENSYADSSPDQDRHHYPHDISQTAHDSRIDISPEEIIDTEHDEHTEHTAMHMEKNPELLSHSGTSHTSHLQDSYLPSDHTLPSHIDFSTEIDNSTDPAVSTNVTEEPHNTINTSPTSLDDNGGNPAHTHLRGNKRADGFSHNFSAENNNGVPPKNIATQPASPFPGGKPEHNISEKISARSETDLIEEKKEVGDPLTKWAIALLSLIVAISLTIGGYYTYQYRHIKRNDSPTTQCSQGLKDIAISVTPELFFMMSVAAQKYNDTQPSLDNACYHLHVQQIDSQSVYNRVLKENGTIAPQIWIPQSSLWIQSLRYLKPDLLGKTSLSLATSPVVLAVQSSEANTLRKIRWSDIISAQQNHGLAQFNNYEWSSLKLALPFGGDFAGTWLTIAAAVASSPAVKTHDTPTLDASLISGKTLSKNASTELRRLLSATPRINLNSPSPNAFLDLLAAQNPEQINVLHSVPVLESQLIDYTNKNRHANITEITPKDFSLIADFPAVALGGTDTDREAAMTFLTIIRDSQEFRNAIHRNGLRSADGSGDLAPAIKSTIVKPTPIQKSFPIVTVIDPAVAHSLYMKTILTH